MQAVGIGSARPLEEPATSEVNERVELSGFGGFIVRGDPDEFDLLNGFRWGVGAAMPTRQNLRLTAELFGRPSAEFDRIVLGDAGLDPDALPRAQRVEVPDHREARLALRRNGDDPILRRPLRS